MTRLLYLPMLLALAACESTPACPDAGVPLRDLAPASEARLDGPRPDGAAPAQRCGTCHLGPTAELKTGLHSHFPEGCLKCHANGLAHQDSPTTVEAELDLSVERCAGCHVVFAPDFLRDDGTKAGSYGGSLKVSKLTLFPKYQHLLGGHDTTVDYNESRPHAWALKDHRESKRAKSTVCLQCKSTAVATFWNEQRRGKPVFSKDLSWADAVERIKARWPKTLDYGIGCTHCHSPHSTKIRLVRKELVAAILERGTDPGSPKNFIPKSAGELHAKLNEPGSPHKLSAEARRLAGTLTCAQCHAQYVAGPGVDGVLRDSLPWRKVGELEAHHQARFALMQDWKHGGTGLPGVKARQADAESYWGSKHHALGVGCADCHMEHASGYANHSMTSPLKNLEGACSKCHDSSGLKTKVVALQDGVMQKAQQLELALDAVLTKIEALTGAPGADQAKLAQARERFMRALLLWDWTAVAGSSAGFHNAAEASANLAAADGEVAQAKALLGL